MFNRYMRGMSNGGLITGHALTNEQLQQYVPSIFASEAHESRSARFAPIPTIDVVEGLRREGFEPFFAQQARTRIEGKAEFTKHMIRLRHESLTNDAAEAFEVILINANDGTSSYQLLPGFFRMVCANGLMVGDTFEEVRVKHSGRAIDDVIEGTYSVLEDAPRIIDRMEEFKGTALTHVQRMEYAARALELRELPLEPEDLLRRRRYADNASDLWSTFNVVQENVIRGGQRYWTADMSRRQKVREVRAIDQSKKINRALWDNAEELVAA